MKNILVTGGAGYLGSHIVEILIKKKFKVFIVDNLITGHRRLINKKAKFFNININNLIKLKKIILINKIDSIIHLAALLNVNESQKKSKKYFFNNVNGSKTLLEACKNTSVKNFIFSSTAAVYKDGIFKVKENSPLKPKSVYGKTKLKAEKLIKSNLKKNNITYAILRYFNVCGASNSRKIGQINIYGNDYKTKDGTCIRDFIHVLDISDIHLKILNKINSRKKSVTLNCGYGVGKSVLEVVKSFEKHSKRKIKIIYKPRRRADLSQIISNNMKLKKYLSWKPKYNKLSLMVKSSINWEKKI